MAVRATAVMPLVATAALGLSGESTLGSAISALAINKESAEHVQRICQGSAAQKEGFGGGERLETDGFSMFLDDFRCFLDLFGHGI